MDTPPDSPPPENPNPASPPVVPAEIIPPGAQGYSYTYAQPIPGTPRANPLAVTSLVAGIASLISCCCCCLLPAPIIAIVCGHVALSQMRRTGNYEGRGMALAGLIMGYAGIALFILNMIFRIAFFTNSEEMKQAIEDFRQRIEQAQSSDGGSK